MFYHRENRYTHSVYAIRRYDVTDRPPRPHSPEGASIPRIVDTTSLGAATSSSITNMIDLVRQKQTRGISFFFFYFPRFLGGLRGNII